MQKVIPWESKVLNFQKEVYNLYDENAQQEGFNITKKEYIINGR